MAITGISNTELTDTFNTFRTNVNHIKGRAADTETNNTFAGTQTFDTANVTTLQFSDSTTLTTAPTAGDAIPFAIALG